MKLVKTIDIAQPVKQVWQIVAEDFANAGIWMSGVVHSQSTECGRVCTIQNKPDGLQAIETILKNDPENHTLIFEVIPKVKKGPGLPVVKNVVEIELYPSGDGCKVVWNSDVTLNPLGKLLYPLLRLGFSKAFGDILDDLRIYSETGQPSQRKQKLDRKSGVPITASNN